MEWCPCMVRSNASLVMVTDTHTTENICELPSPRAFSLGQRLHNSLHSSKLRISITVLKVKTLGLTAEALESHNERQHYTDTRLTAASTGENHMTEAKTHVTLPVTLPTTLSDGGQTHAQTHRYSVNVLSFRGQILAWTGHPKYSVLVECTGSHLQRQLNSWQESISVGCVPPALYRTGGLPDRTPPPAPLLRAVKMYSL